jgi:hypothetical protein
MLCNTLLIVKLYVINPKAFLGYLEKGNVTSLHPFGHEQYPSDIVGQNSSTHCIKYPNASIAIHLGFGLVMEYLS